MSNEQTGKLIDVIAMALCERNQGRNCYPSSQNVDSATAIVGELQSRYRIEPLENTVEEEATK